MVALPVASPESNPEEEAVMVRVSDEVQSKSVVTSLVEPSLKVAMAFNWVVLPMATVACAGTTATEANSAPAAAPLPAAAGLPAASVAATVSVPLTAERALLVCLTTAGVRDELTTALG